MKFSGKMWHMIILKVAKNQGFIHPVSRKYIFGKTTGGVLRVKGTIFKYNSN